jgi:hypothetical protein
MNKLKLLLLLFLVPGFLIGQKHELTQLFSKEEPLDIKLSISVKGVKAINNDTIYTAAMMHFKSGEAWDSIPVLVRARGYFRRKECSYPPLKIKIKKDDAKGTVFAGNKSLKLVLPCNTAKDNSLIMKEYICYQLYEPITQYTFNTRLLNIEFNDVSGKKVKASQVTGFFIEDDDLVAKRYNGKVVQDLKLHPKLLQEANSVRHDMFQYMIANTDWSTTFLHNAKLIQLDSTKEYIPLAYDFDMSGFVDPPYAQVNETLGIASVRDRLFRGFCRSDEAYQAVRQEYIQHESSIMAVLAQYQNQVDPRQYSAMVKYLEKFYDIFKSDSQFKSEILSKCRTK